MNQIKVVGKATFFSKKKNQDYFVLHCVFQREGVDGLAVEAKFVSKEIYDKSVINQSYYLVYDAYSNGRAFISDLREVHKTV